MRKSIPIRFNGRERKVIYLTFDGGTEKYTANLLDILKKNNVKGSPNSVKQENIENFKNYGPTKKVLRN
ncbi:polysaccharide deacetylase family protein [Bacillus thuringiensis]|uniref:polysaccharide deacetylase family protein n=1 Tax=Bacillus thuringiensis TaxID=1428 RepID=UPI0032602C8D